MRIFEPTDNELAEWEEWCDSRPPEVAEVARRFPPWELYRIESGHCCTVYSYGEKEGGGVSLTVSVTGEYNRVAFPRNVFGIDPDELTPCDLPAADEKLGAVMTDKDEVAKFIAFLRDDGDPGPTP